MTTDPILEYLKNCDELSEFCDHDCRVNRDSIRYEIMRRTGKNIFVSVEFSAICTRRGSGEPYEQDCYGRIECHLDDQGEISGACAI